MITKELKDQLANINDLDRERYEDKVRETVRDEMFPEDELAIHRKAIAKLFELIASLHPDEVNHEEFDVYNSRIESIKENIKNV